MSRSISCGAGTPARETAGQVSQYADTDNVHSSQTPGSDADSMDTASRGQECPPHTFMFPTRTYQYRRRLPHIQKFNRPLFVTFCKLLHNQFSERARYLVLKHCIHDHGKRIDLHAAVIMPDHVHMLFTLLRDERGWPYPMQKILKMIKGTSARDINRLLGSSGPVWQDESFDHVLRSQESLEEKIEYIRTSPVRAGLVQKPEEYSWLWLKP
ncbi:MAG: hypothetical protein DMG92_05020 [Acidobacteria bacterium]|nr:MAG: hypothetical protein DMG92_05020 [Acidobacteriota bacterium]